MPKLGGCWTGVIVMVMLARGGRGEASKAPENERSLPEILDLESPAFYDAILTIRSVPSADAKRLWPILDRCRREVDAGAPDGDDETQLIQSQRREACSRMGRLTAGLAWEGDRDRAFEMFDSLPAGHWLRGPLVLGLADGKLAEVLSGLPPATRPAPAAEPRSPLPERLKGAAVDLQDAWQLHDVLVAGYGAQLDSGGSAGDIPYLERQDDFEAAIADFLRRKTRADDTVALLRRFVWGGGCGTGSGALYEPRNRILLLAHLEAGHHALAAGAALASTGDEEGAPSVLPEGWERRLLRMLGYDWEAFYVGRFLDGWPGAAAVLGRHGSDRAGRLLLAARGILLSEEPDALLADAEDYLPALAAFVAPGGGCQDYGTVSSLDIERDPDAGPVGAEVEAEVLDVLDAHVGPSSSLREAETAAHLLVKACREESRLAFRRMVRSPYAKVRVAGALALRSFGEAVSPATRVPPVVFRLTIDGAPARDFALTQTLADAGERGWTTSTTRTDADGQIRVDRDPFLDPKDVVETISFSPTEPAGPDDPWFSVEVPRPVRLDLVVPVSVSTQALTLSCPWAEGERAFVHFLSTGTARQVGPHSMRALSPFPPGPVRFGRLQRGQYRLLVYSSAGHWQSEEVALGDRPLAIECGPMEPFGGLHPEPDLNPEEADASAAPEG
jgi:hypothetical protein